MSESEAEPDSQSPPPPSEEDLRLAMKAFRKRLKLTQLDEESRLGYGPTSTGGRSGVVGIRPPDQYPKEVWRELARQGKLCNLGKGLYGLGSE